jgi:hypothetical protein
MLLNTLTGTGQPLPTKTFLVLSARGAEAKKLWLKGSMGLLESDILDLNLPFILSLT